MNIYWSGGRSAHAGGVLNSVGSATVAELMSFSTLPQGWHHGEGGPVPAKTIALAISIVSYIRQFGLVDVDTFAGCGGEISLVASCNEYDIEAIIEDDGSVSVASDRNGRQVSYKSRLDYDDAKKEISYIVGKAWSTSEYFTPETMTLNDSALLVWPSVTSAGAYPSSNMNVYEQPAQAFALTFEPTTTISLPSLLFSGNSTDPRCLEIAG